MYSSVHVDHKVGVSYVSCKHANNESCLLPVAESCVTLLRHVSEGIGSRERWLRCKIDQMSR